MPKYIIRDNVPILDEHTLYDDDGEAIVTFDVKKLEQIAKRNNARIKKTGDLIPLVIGHTKDGEDEDKQPEIVGYAKDLRVRPFRRTGKKAIHARFFFFKDKVPKARNFPRRSIELWLSDGKIDPISLLGATTPERDLGLLQLEKTGAVIQFSASGKKKYKRLLDAQPQEKPNTMDEKAIVAAVMKAMEQSDIWKWAESKMKEEEAGGDDNLDGDVDGLDLPPEEGDEVDPEDLNGEELPDDMEDGQDDLEGEEDEDDLGEEPVRYNMGATYPSGNNTCTPAFGATNRNPSNMNKKKPATSNHNIEKKGKAGHAPASGPQKMQRSNGSGQLLRFQKQVGRLARENENLRLKFQRSERERDLMELAAEGFDFDPVEELDYVTQLPDDHYAYHLNRIKKRYQRAPVGDARFDLEMSRSPQTGGTPAGRTKEQARQIADYASKKGISYEEAMTAFDSE